MVRKKKRKKQPTLRSLIVTLIADEGPRKLSGMTRILGSSYQSLNSEALKLRRPNLEPINSLRMLTTHLSTVIRELEMDPEMESNSVAIFNILRGDWMQYVFSLKTSSVIQQLADWYIFYHLGDNPANMVRSLYFRLSKNVHERVEYTDAGRAVEEGKEMFDWPAPILSQSLAGFLEDFHSTMEIGVITILNILASKISSERFQDKAQQLINKEAFKKADLRRAAQLLKNWHS